MTCLNRGGWLLTGMLTSVALARVTLAQDNDADVRAQLLRAAEQMRNDGEFGRAEQILRNHLVDSNGAIVEDYANALEIIRRIRLDFALSADGLLAKIRKDIPDATLEDVEHWRAGNALPYLQHLRIDGEIRYFNREPSNLFRFCPEAKARRDEHRQASQPASRQKPDFVLTDHVARLVEIGEAAELPEIYPVKHRVTYTLKVNPGHPLVKAGARVRCWLPFPQEYRQQKDVQLIAARPVMPVVASNGSAQRTLYFDQTLDDPAKPVEFSAEFTYRSYAYYPKLDPDKVQPYDRDSALYKEFTAARPPHISFFPAMRSTAQSIVGDETNPLRQARRIFRWVSQNIHYCAEMEYSTIRNLSLKALVTRRGDCGVQSMIFITLCRCVGIPARWQSGWETKPVDWNMHDWAEFYVEPWGWLPADPSYGLQNHPDPRVQEFYCGHQDAYRLIVNLDYARGLAPPKPSLRSEPNDFQRGEVEIDGKNLYFDEWDWTFDFKTELPGATSQPVVAASQPAVATSQPAGIGIGPDGIAKLYVPKRFRLHDGKIDLLIHFHGGYDRVSLAADETGISAAVLFVTRPGLSKAYEQPFSDEKLFGQVIDSAIASLKSTGKVPSDAALGRVYLSSFSAGFGAVRALLRVPRYFEMIDGIAMADSIYCGYEGAADEHKVDAAKMADFRRFAKEAAAGRKFMLLTHSAQVPDGYASTTETGDDLIAFVGAQRRDDDRSGPGVMQQRSRADAGNFHVLGFAGADGKDHGEHLRNLAAWYRLLPIAEP